MIKRILFSILTWFLVCNLQSCIPVKTVKSIPTYKIVKAKSHSKKKDKKYTKFVFLNKKHASNFVQFLEKNYKVFRYKGRIYFTDNVLRSTNKNFNLTVYFTVNESKYISLVNLFSKDRKDSFDPGYNKDLDELVQTGHVYNFIEITVTDDGNEDYLKEGSKFKNELYSFLDNLRIQYNIYLSQNPFN
ncbi:hypothetical protein [Lutibacter sp.]|uniref:hypothetical protein n=1 Tax=Lutibacter sp. TaxID=1925666 RepID=UPI0025C1D06B|nr:hypothetical protein [Lutibacter sp.]MCF6181846.1 hypothetical protein [Lutibacter sp.]